MPLTLKTQGEYTDIYEDKTRPNLFVIKFKIASFLDPNVATSIIREEWSILVQKKNIALVINIKTITQPISLLAGLFFWAFEDLAKHDSTIAICNPTPMTHRMLMMCGIDKMISIEKSYHQAREVVLAGKPSAKNTFWQIFKRNA